MQGEGNYGGSRQGSPRESQQGSGVKPLQGSAQGSVGSTPCTGGQAHGFAQDCAAAKAAAKAGIARVVPQGLHEQAMIDVSWYSSLILSPLPLVAVVPAVPLVPMSNEPPVPPSSHASLASCFYMRAGHHTPDAVLVVHYRWPSSKLLWTTLLQWKLPRSMWLLEGWGHSIDSTVSGLGVLL